jgi:hypothetical protein
VHLLQKVFDTAYFQNIQGCEKIKLQACAHVMPNSKGYEEN